MREFIVALRRLVQRPSFAAAAILTLALGIAAPTALSAVNAAASQPRSRRCSSHRLHE
jgi:hypothetical protein